MSAVERVSKLRGYVADDYLDAMPEAFEVLLETLKQLSSRVKEERIFPDETLVLRALKETPLSTVKVVILGKEPYTDGCANGLAWDALRGVKVPECLKTIIQSLIGVESENLYNGRSYLDHLPRQGVLLLNKSLTSVAKRDGVHATAWAPFFEALVSGLSRMDNLVWSAWGDSLAKVNVTNPTHILLKEPNPSKLDGRDFSKVFININSSLQTMGQPPIVW